MKAWAVLVLSAALLSGCAVGTVIDTTATVVGAAVDGVASVAGAAVDVVTDD